MEQTTYFEHYRICTNYDGSPEEVSRTGAAINYKAIDTRSNEPVRLQVIPVGTVDQTKREQFEERVRTAQKLDHVNIAKVLTTGIDHDQFGIVSEYLDGETADSWIVKHGTMTADAVLRVGLQVVRAMGAAAFFGLTHRAIQPPNLMIVPGQSPDGGWPFIKLLNFGLAGLELHSESVEARELAPAMLPQFASPEQLSGGEIDFRSEIYSLGATICFLLTGAVPLAASELKASLRVRRLPELRRAPKPLRKLLVRMLREKPEDRPLDPVAFESEMRQALTQIERRQAMRRRFGLPLPVAIPKREKKVREPITPMAQVLRGCVAFAVLLLGAAAIAEIFFKDKIPFLRSEGPIGVQVGVPNAQAFASSPAAVARPAANANIPANQATTSGVAANSKAGTPDQSGNLPAAQRPPAITSAEMTSQPAATNSPAANTQPSPATTTNSPQIASAKRATEPAPPAQGPDEQASNSEDHGQSASTESDDTQTEAKKKSADSAPPRTWASKNRQITRYSPQTNYGNRAYPRQTRSRVIGMTPEGRMILRLPSGRIIVVTPRYQDDLIGAPHRRTYVPPYQPFYPQGYPYND